MQNQKIYQKKYIQQNLFKYNSVTYKKYNDSVSNIYEYELVINDKQSKKTKEFTIIMNLKNNTDFEMSFSI